LGVVLELELEDELFPEAAVLEGDPPEVTPVPPAPIPPAPVEVAWYDEELGE
jgi:hypothetical protein